ncbi:putative membrane protein [hydrothermal vent metagenome]|uniref:Putative membrane protein n=1 Tax=hydrothermal vent metagenome TaxID=652676 RepID=A0A3B0YLH7_9ZZZZ
MPTPINVQKYRQSLFLIVVPLWLIAILSTTNPLETLYNYWHFTLAGLFGAVVANSTGAGGGIVFIPFFTSLGLSTADTRGTSILIQCFGMTAGAISWLTTSKIANHHSKFLFTLNTQLILICSPFAIIGILIAQYVFPINNAYYLIFMFRVFSIIFGAIIITLLIKKHHTSHTYFQLSKIDTLALAVISFIGGLITAWISIGIGEFIAIFLILRRYPTMIAISMGVVLSSISVLTAANLHINITHTVNWEIVIFAAPAAILSGTFAYAFSEKLGANRLKLFFAIWILTTGLIM